VTQSILASAAIDDVEEVVAGVVTVSTLPLVVCANNFLFWLVRVLRSGSSLL